MKLTPEETAIMVKVRDLMYSRYNTIEGRVKPYICWTILEVATGRECMFGGSRLPAQMERVGGDAERLYRKISWALGAGVPSMGCFISEEMHHFGPNAVRHAQRFEAEARLAWLDRIIEMEEIK